jgi:hypothetical protein
MSSFWLTLFRLSRMRLRDPSSDVAARRGVGRVHGEFLDFVKHLGGQLHTDCVRLLQLAPAVSEVVEEAVVEARTDEVVGYMLYTRRAMSVCLASNAFRMSSVVTRPRKRRTPR